MNQAVLSRDLRVEVRYHRKINLDVKALLHISNPGDVRGQAGYGESYQLHAAPTELL
jgi:hypothetical protein